VKAMIAVALTALALTGCMSAEKQAAKEKEFVHDENSLATAQRNATVQCTEDAQCSKAWALTARYVKEHTSTSVTRADDNSIESDVPYESGEPIYSATRVAKGSGATITLYAQCRGMYGTDGAKGGDYDSCVEKIVPTQNKFRAYLSQHLSDN